jgi:hypothetical protein
LQGIDFKSQSSSEHLRKNTYKEHKEVEKKEEPSEEGVVAYV